MILIVDDKPENIFSLKRTLELNGFETDSASSGEEALKKVLDNNYVLIILDVQMPGMDGFEVAEALAGYSKSKDIPVLFLSAVNTNKKFITKGYTSGGVDYVTKPVDADILMLKVKTLYELYEQKRELKRISDSLKEEIESRKKTEKELNKRVEELQSILRSMPQIAFTVNPDGKLEYTNEQWHLYSDSLSHLPDVHPSDQQVADDLAVAMKKGESFLGEMRIRNLLTREYRYHLLKIIPVKEGSKVLKWVGTLTDIHMQKAANELLETKVEDRTKELLEKNKLLEASNYELQQFASVASHDLKEPLRKIQVFSSIILERFIKENDPAASGMSRIVGASQRMSNLINDLLNYSRLSINTLFDKINLKLIVEEIISDLEIRIQEKGAVINVTDMPEIDGIPGQIRQMFQNIISNSLKFTRPDVTPVINISAELVSEKSPYASPDEKGKYCRITVQDNGIGFNNDYREKIFTIFQRLNSREEFEGTGIGLAIVKKIADKHNGIITAQGEEGEGAVFIIVLPAEQVVHPALIEA